MLDVTDAVEYRNVLTTVAVRIARSSALIARCHASGDPCLARSQSIDDVPHAVLQSRLSLGSTPSNEWLRYSV